MINDRMSTILMPYQNKKSFVQTSRSVSFAVYLIVIVLQSVAAQAANSFLCESCAVNGHTLVYPILKKDSQWSPSQLPPFDRRVWKNKDANPEFFSGLSSHETFATTITIHNTAATPVNIYYLKHWYLYFIEKAWIINRCDAVPAQPDEWETLPTFNDIVMSGVNFSLPANSCSRLILSTKNSLMRNFDFSLVSSQYITKYRDTQELMLWLFYGFSISMAIAIFCSWLVNRDKSHVIYVCYLLFMMIGITAIANHGNVLGAYLSTAALSHLLVGIHCLILLPMIAFAVTYFKGKHLSSHMLEMMAGTALLTIIVAIGAFFMSYFAPVIYAVTFLSIVFCITACTVAIQCGMRGNKHAWIFFCGWILIYYVLIKYLFIILFNIDTDLITFHTELRLIFATESVIVAIALALRLREILQGTRHVQYQIKEVKSRIESEIKQRIELRNELLEAEGNRERYLRQEVEHRNHELNVIVQELSSANKDLDRLRLTDPLTQLGNRIYLYEGGRLEVDYQAQSGQQTMGVLMLDVDHFKLVNDRHGHQAGDLVLKTIAHTMAGIIDKRHAIISRFGGEEFVAIIPKTNADELEKMAQSIRRTIEQLSIETQKETIKITVSIGTHVFLPQPGEALDAYIGPADNALYRAKQTGRNKVVASTALGGPPQ